MKWWSVTPADWCHVRVSMPRKMMKWPCGSIKTKKTISDRGLLVCHVTVTTMDLGLLPPPPPNPNPNSNLPNPPQGKPPNPISAEIPSVNPPKSTSIHPHDTPTPEIPAETHKASFLEALEDAGAPFRYSLKASPGLD